MLINKIDQYFKDLGMFRCGNYVVTLDTPFTFFSCVTRVPINN